MKAIKLFGSLLFYLVLAGYSCYATEKSVHLLFYSIPQVVVWMITIAFFIMASIGSAIFVEAIGSKNFVENRSLKLWGGLALVLVFWLLTSLPTNTHTFFYEARIGGVVNSDIKQTNEYLDQIINKGPKNGKPTALDSIGTEINNNVSKFSSKFSDEIHGKGISGNIGTGTIAQQYLDSIAKYTGIKNQIEAKHYDKYTDDIAQQYLDKIDEDLKHALSSHSITNEDVDKAKKIKNDLNTLSDSLSLRIATNTLKDSEVHQASEVIKEGYNLIFTKNGFLNFKSDEDIEIYTKNPEIGQTRTEELRSVYKVVQDFFQGKLPADIWQYLLIAILVDIAAFIFFDIFYSTLKQNRF